MGGGSDALQRGEGRRARGGAADRRPALDREYRREMAAVLLERAVRRVAEA